MNPSPAPYVHPDPRRPARAFAPLRTLLFVVLAACLLELLLR